MSKGCMGIYNSSHVKRLHRYSKDLTREIVLAVSTEAIFGLVTIVFSFRSRSSSAVFCACLNPCNRNEILPSHTFSNIDVIKLLLPV